MFNYKQLGLIPKEEAENSLRPYMCIYSAKPYNIKKKLLFVRI